MYAGLFFNFKCSIDLSEELKKEKDENDRLEQEKKDWLSRGVSAEFEKKEKVSVIIG